MREGKERRRYVRRDVSIQGIAMLPDGHHATCEVSDISETGAQIALETPREMPHRFMLKIGGPVPVYRFCELMRQEGAMLGVRFPNRPMTVH